MGSSTPSAKPRTRRARCRIDGPIQPDGNADLIAKGLTGHPDNAVGHHTPATPYTYRIKARFEGSKGVGTRLDARKCDFTFTKQ